MAEAGTDGVGIAVETAEGEATETAGLVVARVAPGELPGLALGVVNAAGVPEAEALGLGVPETDAPGTGVAEAAGAGVIPFVSSRLRVLPLFDLWA